jgi:DNA-binding NarL/FixJ family response regulator
MVKRVLIADDNRDVRKAIRGLLGRWPNLDICAETRDGREAVDAALALRPEFLILDLMMPGLNGVEVASILRKTLPGTKTIVFTMFGDNVGEKLASAAGIDIVLRKADGLSPLTHAIDDLLRQHSAA